MKLNFWTERQNSTAMELQQSDPSLPPKSWGKLISCKNEQQKGITVEFYTTFL